MPLRPSTSWWRQLTTPLPDEVTSEHPGRTFALVELLVRASWRRQGIAAALHDLILEDRPEERATLTVPPTATPAQQRIPEVGLAQDSPDPRRRTRLRRYPTCSSPPCPRAPDGRREIASVRRNDHGVTGQASIIYTVNCPL